MGNVQMAVISELANLGNKSKPKGDSKPRESRIRNKERETALNAVDKVIVFKSIV